MNDDIKRIEEKQKLANLQIDKRLTNLEIAVENAHHTIHLEPVSEDIYMELTKLKEQIVILKVEKKAELEKMNQIAKSVNISALINEINELQEAFERMRKDFESKILYIEGMQEKIKDMVSKDAANEDPSLVKKSLFSLSERLNAIERKTDSFDRKMSVLRKTTPIILE